MKLLEISYDKYKELLSKEDYESLIGLDPTDNKSYSKWILQRYLSSKTEDTKNTLLDTYFPYFLKKYDDYKKANLLPIELKDIMKFKTIKQFYDYIHENYKELDSQLEIKQASKKKEYEVWYEDKYVLIATPKSYGASRLLGGDTRWCTAGSSDNMYKNYSKYGTLIISRLKNGDGSFSKYDAYQVYFPDESTIKEDREYESYYNKIDLRDYEDKVPQEGINNAFQEHFLNLIENEEVKKELEKVYIDTENCIDTYGAQEEDISLIAELEGYSYKNTFKLTYYLRDNDEDGGIEEYNESNVTLTYIDNIQAEDVLTLAMNSLGYYSIEDKTYSVITLEYESINTNLEDVYLSYENAPTNISDEQFEWAIKELRNNVNTKNIDVILTNASETDKFLIRNIIEYPNINIDELLEPREHVLALDGDKINGIMWINSDKFEKRSGISEALNILPKRINETVI